MELVYKIVLINIVKRPLKAFRTIYYYDLYKYKFLFLSLVGIATSVNRKVFKLANINTDLLKPLAFAVGFGALVGWLSLVILSRLIYWSGKWLKGRSSAEDILDIISYAALPSILLLGSALTSIILLRSNGYTGPEYPHIWSNTNYKIVQINFYFGMMLNLYYLALLVIGISVAQGFPIIKASLNFILAVLIVLIPVALLIFLGTHGASS